MADPNRRDRRARARIRAFMGFHGPFDAVQMGDFAEALRLLDAVYPDGGNIEDRHALQDFLTRLQPAAKPDEDVSCSDT